MLAATQKRKGEDSKVERLLADIRTLRSDGRSVIVFTQFTDTVDHLRDILAGPFGSRAAVFTGAGVEVNHASEWCVASKADLMKKASAGEIDVLLATDAASEGINLQMFSAVINFDMPWNPARVEQRVGRIDRLGQRADEVVVLNYFVANTIEEQVYKALLGRVNDWDAFVGEYQPILGAIEQAIEAVALLPQGSRENALEERRSLLAKQREESQASGVHLGDDDDWPVGHETG
jgi:ERCC4-related helicase